MSDTTGVMNDPNRQSKRMLLMAVAVVVLAAVGSFISNSFTDETSNTSTDATLDENSNGGKIADRTEVIRDLVKDE